MDKGDINYSPIGQNKYLNTSREMFVTVSKTLKNIKLVLFPFPTYHEDLFKQCEALHRASITWGTPYER